MATPVVFAQLIGGARPKAKPRKRRASVRPHTIGVIDVNTYARLRPVMDAMNKAQRRFQFVSVSTVLPTGIGVISKRVLDIAKANGFRVTKTAMASLEENLFADDFTPFLEEIQSKLTLDALAALVALKLAFVDDEGFEADLFSSSEGTVAMISTFELREYARKARRPFEACVAALMVAQTWASMFDHVDFHQETTGCLFDYCDNRDDIVVGLRKMRVSAEALALFPEAEQDAVKAVVAAIAEYKR